MRQKCLEDFLNEEVDWRADGERLRRRIKRVVQQCIDLEEIDLAKKIRALPVLDGNQPVAALAFARDVLKIVEGE